MASVLRKLWTALLLLVFLALVYVHIRARFIVPINFDEEYLVWGGWLIGHGGVPYRDFFEPKPPVAFFANYLGLALFGLKGSLYRIVPTVIAVGALFFFYLAVLKRKVTPWLALLLTAQVGLWLLGPEFHDSGLNDSETYGFSFTLLGFSFGSLSGSSAIRGRKRALQLTSGICFGLAVFSKELFVFSVAPAWFLAARSREDGGWDWRQLMWSAAGAVAVALALLVYLVSHSAFGSYMDLIGFYRSFAANYCIDIGGFPRVTGFEDLKTSWGRLHDVLYNVKHLAFVLALGAFLLLLIRRRVESVAGRVELAVVFLALVLGMAAISVGNCFWNHYFLMGTSGLTLLSLVGAETLNGFISEKGTLVSGLAMCGLSALLLFVGFEPTKAVLKEQLSFQHVPWPPILLQTINEHSKPGDYILTTEGPLLYVDQNRKNPLGLNFFVDEILDYVTAKNRVLQMDVLRANLEKHLPKVCYFPAWLRNRQDKFHELLFDPLLLKYNYIKVNELIWHLPDAK
jgi:4-amino-4-deoxy-L-arabinose transferase-like glycosyltransferase